MITTYRIGKDCLKDSDRPVKYSANIDVGITTGGITVINHETKEFDLVNYVGDYEATETLYPKIYMYAMSASNTYLNHISESMDKLGIPKGGLKDMEISVEYTFPFGQASLGIYTFLSSFSTSILRNEVRGMTFIPPIVGKTFLFQKYKDNLKQEQSLVKDDSSFDVKSVLNFNNIEVKKSELKRLVEQEFSNLLPVHYFKTKDKATGKPKWKYNYTHHMADSLLLAVFRHYDFFNELYPNMTLRKPDLNLIELIESGDKNE